MHVVRAGFAGLIALIAALALSLPSFAVAMAFASRRCPACDPHGYCTLVLCLIDPRVPLAVATVVGLVIGAGAWQVARRWRLHRVG